MKKINIAIILLIVQIIALPHSLFGGPPLSQASRPKKSRQAPQPPRPSHQTAPGYNLFSGNLQQPPSTQVSHVSAPLTSPQPQLPQPRARNTYQAPQPPVPSTLSSVHSQAYGPLYRSQAQGTLTRVTHTQPPITNDGNPSPVQKKRNHEEVDGESDTGDTKRFRVAPSENSENTVQLLSSFDGTSIQVSTGLAFEFSETIRDYLEHAQKKSITLQCYDKILRHLEATFTTIEALISQEHYQTSDPTQQCLLLEETLLRYFSAKTISQDDIEELKKLATYLGFPVLIDACTRADDMLRVSNYVQDHLKNKPFSSIQECLIIIQTITDQSQPTLNEIQFLWDIALAYQHDALVVIARVLHTLEEFRLHQNDADQPPLDILVTYIQDKHPDTEEIAVLNLLATGNSLPNLSTVCQAILHPESPRLVCPPNYRPASPQLSPENEHDNEVVKTLQKFTLTAPSSASCATLLGEEPCHYQRFPTTKPIEPVKDINDILKRMQNDELSPEEFNALFQKVAEYLESNPNNTSHLQKTFGVEFNLELPNLHL